MGLYAGARKPMEICLVVFFALCLGIFPVLHNGDQPVALAAGESTPTLSVTPEIVHPYQTVAITGQGFAPNEQVSIIFYNAGYGPVLTCNGQGTCVGKITVMPFGGVQGMYAMTGTGTQSGLQATLQVQVNPGFQLSIPQPGASRQAGANNNSSLLKVGPGATLDMQGDAFAANETVSVYLGTSQGTLEGTPTTDSSGHLGFDFVLLTVMTPGRYVVTVVRSQQHPLNVMQPFEVVPPHMTSSAQIQFGQKVNLTLHGFLARETSTISWNANGGQTLGTLFADYGGNASTCKGNSTQYCIIPPSAPDGTYILTATGDSSGLQATSSMKLKPGIALSPIMGSPGSPITVSGGGFTPNETVKVYFQAKQNGQVSGTVDSTGAFSVQLTVPTKYKSGTYYVYAYNEAGTQKASAQFYISQPSISLGDGNPVTYGIPVSFGGQGFFAGENVVVYWNYQQAGQKEIKVLTADQNGFVMTTIITPSDPNSGSVNVAAFGLTSKLQAEIQVTEQGAIVAHPAHAKVGTRVTVKGGGYDSDEVVTVSFAGTNIGMATTNAMGAFTMTFVVPDGVSGNQWIDGTGGTSGLNFEVLFRVDP